MNTPDGYLRTARGALVRKGYAELLDHWLSCLGDELPDGAQRVEGGRGGSVRIPLGDGGAAYVRRYRHGGFLGPLLGEIYFGRSYRPWRELEATQAARSAGITAPEVLAAVVQPLAGPWDGFAYRGVLVTRELGSRRTLREVLAAPGSDAEIDRWMEVVLDVVSRLHGVGIEHRDLNFTNLLAGASPAEGLAVIDFDGATISAGPVGGLARRMARRRLARSLAKLPGARLTPREAYRRIDALAGAMEADRRGVAGTGGAF